MRASILVLLLSIILPSTATLADESDLIWSTFLGGDSAEEGNDIAVDGAGHAYVVGTTLSPDFPTTAGVFDSLLDAYDVFVTKLNPAGSALEYSTFLGGSAYDHGYGIAIDDYGYAFVTGETPSSDFPITWGAFDTAYNGGYDVFIVKLDQTGNSLVYSTFLGGTQSDDGRAIAVDDSGRVYLNGRTYSSDFPVTVGAVDETLGGSVDAFLTRLNYLGSALDYCTYLGGTGIEHGFGIAVDSSGSVYATGYTSSIDFPTTDGAFMEMLNGSEADAFVSRLNPAGDSLAYSSFMGGNAEDVGRDIVIDGSGHAYLTGTTLSDNFPTTVEAYDPTPNGERDVFVAKLNATGTDVEYATYLGGAINDYGTGIALDGVRNAYLTGYTQSGDFPTTAGAYDQTHNALYDVFLARLDPTGHILCYATFLGGEGVDYGADIALDGNFYAYVTGQTYSANFPATTGAFDTTLNVTHDDARDAFVFKFITDNVSPQAIENLQIALESGLKNSGNLHLWWTQPFDDVGVAGYVIYRSIEPGSLGDSLAGTVDTVYNDLGAAGSVGLNYYYAAKAVDHAGNKSEASNRVGEFDRTLKNDQ